MAKEQSKVAENKSEIVTEVPMACADELAAVEFFEKHRWGDTGPCCPRCGSTNVYQMMNTKGGGGRNERFLWRCRECPKASSQYTVRIGTVMEDSRIPLRFWALALWLACSSKKGVSAKQIQRQSGLSYKSALFLMHRIRFAMAPANGRDGGKLTGTVEVDESFIGGKPRYKSPHNPRGTKGKQPVVGMVERQGRVRVRVAADITAKTLKQAIRDHVDKSAHIMTDEHAGYKGIDSEFASHQYVAHARREYVRGDVTTNTIESFWAIMKRGIYGVYHNVSRKHLQRYLDEFEFRYNHRKVDDGARTLAAIKGAVGKKLVYTDPAN